MAKESNGLLAFLRKTYDAIFKREFGQNGFLDISDTNAHVGNFVCLKAEGSADAVISAAVTTYGDDLSSYTLNKGDVVYGPFTSVTLTSGEVLAYYKQRVD